MGKHETVEASASILRPFTSTFTSTKLQRAKRESAIGLWGLCEVWENREAAFSPCVSHAASLAIFWQIFFQRFLFRPERPLFQAVSVASRPMHSAGMAQPRGTYNRFRIEEDMWLCEEVLKANPFNREQKTEAWAQIVENLNAIPIFGKPTGERACKHRLEDLLLQYRSGDVAKLRRSGSEEQFQILQELIAQIIQVKESHGADDDEEEKVEKPKKAKEKSSACKRPFLVSMAQPTEIQRRIQIEIPTLKKPRLLPAPSPVVRPVLAVRVPREVTVVAPPAVASVSETASHSDNYVSFLIEQNGRQCDLRQKELQQTRDLREKELELERARLEFEERKWQHQLGLLQHQQEMMRDMLQQQNDQQKLIFAFLKQSSSTKTD